MASSVVEYLFESYLFPQLKAFGQINLIALVAVGVCQCIRTAAMCTAGSNFNHIVQYFKAKEHVLIKHGIYKYFRHPSYTAFFYWGVCLQIMLMNPVCAVGFVFALHSFFKERILEEEETLVEFFGEEYLDYRKTSKTYIPYIN
jgi:protein-S-isoprenylcysteine O-methyltransferase